MGNNVGRAYLQIVNDTDFDIITTYVSEYDTYDWANDNCVYKNFNGVAIAAGDYRKEEQNINARANGSPFTMTLKFQDGTVDVFRINMGYAIYVPEPLMFEHRQQSHDLVWNLVISEPQSPNTLYIYVHNTDAQKSNIEAQRHNKRGKELMERKLYEEALVEFDQGARKANQAATIHQIDHNRTLAAQALENQNRVEEAEELNREAEAKIEKHNFAEAIQKLEKAAKLAPSSRISSNLNTLLLLSQGEEFLNQKKFTEAAEKFDTASKVATNEEIIQMIDQKKNAAIAGREGEQQMKKGNYEGALQKFQQASELSNHQSEAASLYGHQLLQEGLLLESDTSEDRSDQAFEKLTQAEEMFQLAENLHHSAENETNLGNMKVKNAANGVFNEGVVLETRAFELLDEEKYGPAKKMLEEALVKYEEAVQKFGQVSGFDDNLRVAEGQVGKVKEAIRSVKEVELESDIRKVRRGGSRRAKVGGGLEEQDQANFKIAD